MLPLQVLLLADRAALIARRRLEAKKSLTDARDRKTRGLGFVQSAVVHARNLWAVANRMERADADRQDRHAAGAP